MKRILLFVLTNVAVVAVLGIVASLLGVNRYLTANGLNLGALLGFALIMGFGGAIISLLISKPMAKWSAGVQIIEQPRNGRRGLDRRDGAQVRRQGGHRHARGRHLRGRPQRLCHRRVQELGPGGRVHRAAAEHDARRGRGGDRPRGGAHRQRRHGHHDADPGRDEHLRRVPEPGDRLCGGQLPAQERRKQQRPRHWLHVTTIVLDIVLGFVAAIIVAWFSRQREFRADAGAPRLRPP
jgi:heat shock protein HtpX